MANRSYVFHVDIFTGKTYDNAAMNHADRIIEKFGGINAMARVLGHRNPSTVQGWKERGVIPAKQHEAIWQAAKAQDIDLSLSDFAAVAPELVKGDAA